MKKSLFLAALATIALASCTQNEDFSQPEKINFNPVNYKAQSTKAPINGAYYTSSNPSFGIFAFHTDKGWNGDGTTINEYIPKSKVSWNETNSEWNTATNAYWPLSGSLTFIGYTPFTSGNTDVNAAYDKATKELTIKNFSAANQDDLMYTLPSDAIDLKANTENYNNGNTANTYDGVPIKFRHALSQIVVTAKVADEYRGATFKINSISLQDMNDNATLTVTENGNPVASWGTPSTRDAVFNILSSVTNALSTTADEVGTPVLVIPQALVDQQQKLVISYSMTFNGVETTTTPAKEIVLATTDLEELAMGKKYTLNLTLYADRILYSPSVAEDWSDDGGSDYDVPEQPTQNP